MNTRDYSLYPSLSLALVLLTSCQSYTPAEQTVHADVMLTVVGAAKGSIQSDDGSISCGSTCSTSKPYGSSIALTATPTDPNWHFAYWVQGSPGLTNPTYQLSLQGSATVEALFLANAIPSCTDHIKNADETDVDCGGSCPGCALGQVCQAPTDCAGSVLCASAMCTAPLTCNTLLQTRPGLADGVYTIDPDGVGNNAPFSVYCDMTTSGGGWTLGFLKNTAHTGNYPDFGGGASNLGVLQNNPATASNSATAAAGWLNLNTFPYTNLRLAAYLGGTASPNYLSADIAKTSLRIQFGQPGYLLYNDSNGYYWCGGPDSYTDHGQGQVNQPTGAPAGCKGHSGLGSGWDFSGANTPNQGLSMCGMDGCNAMSNGFAGGFASYGAAGAAYAIWAR